MVKVYIKERINDQTTIFAGGVIGNTTYLGVTCPMAVPFHGTYHVLLGSNNSGLLRLLITFSGAVRKISFSVEP